jgi:hypothetical protein
MSMFPVKQTKPLDDEIADSWSREIADPRQRSVHGVEATKSRGYWSVGVWAMEHIRDVPLEAKLRAEIIAALRGVPGVEEAEEEDREVWFVTGNPGGAALVTAVAVVIDANAAAIAAEMARD